MNAGVWLMPGFIASHADYSLSRGFRGINATLVTDVCNGKIHIARSLEFVKVNSTKVEIGVDFSFTINEFI
jgi:hypothetical protein